jgi:lysophospholipase L1-like esterase
MIRPFCAAALLIASGADAQTIAGVVRDTGCLVLPGVQVVLKGDSTERSAITDSHGAFAFDALAEPRYSLRASLVGFYQFSRESVLPSDEGSRSLEIRLPLGPLAIRDPPLTVTGPGQPAVATQGRDETATGRMHILNENCESVADASVDLRDTAVTHLPVDNTGRVSIPASTLGDVQIRVTAPGFVPVVVQPGIAPLRFLTPLTVALRRGRSETADILDGRPPMPPKIRIVAMGDSTTAGTPAFESPRESPPSGRGDETSQYAYWLMKAHPGWDVVNQGINGQRSDQIRARFEEDVVATKPAVVVIIAGVNDVYQGRPAQHVEEQLAAMYARAHGVGIRVVAGTILPYNSATPGQNVAMRSINDWIRAQAGADPGVIFADTRAAVADPHNPDRLFSSPDGLHPDAAGYRRMARTIELAIEQALSARQ